MMVINLKQVHFFIILLGQDAVKKKDKMLINYVEA